MRIRTHKDNHMLMPEERQIEDIGGAISVCRAPPHGRPVGAPAGVQVTTVRGIAGRKAQCAVLSREGVNALIDELERVRDEVFGVTPREAGTNHAS